MIALHFLFSALIASAFGFGDAGCFAEGNTRHGYNVHWFLLPARGFALLVLGLLAHAYLGLVPSIALTAAAVLEFSFWHNGTYYETRRRIDYPRYRWTSQSETTTAKISFGFSARVAMLCGGLALRLLAWAGVFSPVLSYPELGANLWAN